MTLQEYLNKQKTSNKPVSILYKFHDPFHQPKWKHFHNYEFDDKKLYHIVNGKKHPYEISKIISWEKPKAEPHFCVYVIELDDNPQWIYVGYSWHAPEKRLTQHNSGLLGNGAAKVFRKGSRGKLRPDLYKSYPKYHTKEEAKKAESTLVETLQRLGYKVESDGLKNRKNKNKPNGAKNNRKKLKKSKFLLDKKDSSSIQKVEVDYSGTSANQPSDWTRYGRHKTIEYKRTEEFLDKLDKDGVKKVETHSTMQDNVKGGHTDVYTIVKSATAHKIRIKNIDTERNKRIKKDSRRKKTSEQPTRKTRSIKMVYTTGDPRKEIALRKYLLDQKKANQPIVIKYN